MIKILEHLLPILVRKGLIFESESIDTVFDIPSDNNTIKVKLVAQNVKIKIEKE